MRLLLRLAWAAAPALAIVTFASARADAGPPPAPCDAERVAWGKSPDVDSATALAGCDLKEGNAIEAARVLSPLANDGDLRSSDRARVRPLFDAARGRVLTLVVETDVPGADVLVDGAWAGRTPLEGPLFVAAGRHTVAARVGGRPPVERALDGGAGTSQAIVLRTAPLRTEDAVGYDAPQSAPASTAQSDRSTALVVVGAAATGVALAVGLTFTVLAVGKSGAVSDAQANIRNGGGDDTSCGSPVGARFAGDCLALHDALSSRDTYANAALVSYAAAAVLGGATIAYLFYTAETHKTPWSRWMASVAPIVGPGTGGIAATGSF